MGAPVTDRPRHHHPGRRPGHPHEVGHAQAAAPARRRADRRPRARDGPRARRRARRRRRAPRARRLVARSIERRAPGQRSSSTRTRCPAPAVRSSRRVAALPDDFDGDVLVVNGDVPLLNADTLSDAHRAPPRPTPLAAPCSRRVLDDPTGYGRIVRERRRRASTASSSRRTRPTTSSPIDEINAGVYVVRRGRAARPAREPHDRQRAGREVPHRRDRRCSATPGREVEAVPVSRAVARRRHQRPRAALRDGRRASTRSSCAAGSWPASRSRTPPPRGSTSPCASSPTSRSARARSSRARRSIATGAIDRPRHDARRLRGRRERRGQAHGRDARRRSAPGASVGPFAYLRPGTLLGADGKIGTFVETKNATIGDGQQGAAPQLHRRHRRSARARTSAPARSPPTTTA